MPRRFIRSQHPGDMGGRWVDDEYQPGAEGGRQATQMSEREIRAMIEESRRRQELMQAAEQVVPASVPEWRQEAARADRQAEEMLANLSFRGGTRQGPDWRRTGQEADRRVEDMLSGLGSLSGVPDPFDVGAVMVEPVGGDNLPDAVAQDVEKGLEPAQQEFDTRRPTPDEWEYGSRAGEGALRSEEQGWRAPMLLPDEGPSYPELHNTIRLAVQHQISGSLDLGLEKVRLRFLNRLI